MTRLSFWSLSTLILQVKTKWILNNNEKKSFRHTSTPLPTQNVGHLHRRLVSFVKHFFANGYISPLFHKHLGNFSLNHVILSHQVSETRVSHLLFQLSHKFGFRWKSDQKSHCYLMLPNQWSTPYVLSEFFSYEVFTMFQTQDTVSFMK